MGLKKYAQNLIFYVNSETIQNNDLFFSSYTGEVIHIQGENHLTITYFNYCKLQAATLLILYTQQQLKHRFGRVQVQVH